MTTVKLAGWGRYPVLDCRVAHCRRQDQSLGLLQSRTLIARGKGRSYGDAALNPECTLSMLAMDRMISFDESTGRLNCEAGVALDEVLALYAPLGWFPPVVPGTAQVTVGGMIAADVHGKNHHVDGCFGTHVESLRLATGNGEVLHCSREENADLFRSTLGGMGLTGVILSTCFWLTRIQSEYLHAETVPTEDLEATMETLADSRGWRYNVAWLDSTAIGGKLGRGLVSRGDFIGGGSPCGAERPSRDLAIPVSFPSFLLNRSSVGLFNSLYHGVGRSRRGPRSVHYRSFFFPLDRVSGWNCLYGRRGFVQYQCVVPGAESHRGLRAILECVENSRHTPYLAVLKLLGSDGEGFLSFPMAGYTLALDFPMLPGTLNLLDSLDDITTAHGGRVYLAKDARCRAEHVREGYRNAPRFAAVRDGLRGARWEFSSVLSRRLGL